MLCECCNKHEATIHEVVITSDKRKVERHLCEVCAREQGVSSDPYIPIDQLISATNYIMGQALTEPTDGQTEPTPEPTETTTTTSQGPMARSAHR